MAKSISRRLADSASPTGAIDGTLSTAAQTNITSVGTLSALTVSGVSKLKAGSTSTPADTAAFISNAAAKLVVNHGNEYGAYIGYANSSTDAVGIQSTTSGGTTGPLLLNPYGSNVGIGTSSPRSILDLDGGSETQLRLQTTNSGSTTSDGLLVSLDSSANAKAYIWNYENAEMIFGTNNTERMQLDQNGTLLLTTPSSGAYGYLNIKEAGSGDVRFGMQSGNDYDAIAGTWTNNNLLFYTNGSQRMQLTSGGVLKLKTSRSTYVDATEDSSASSHMFVTNDGVGDFSQEAGHLVIQARTHTSVYRDIIFAGGTGNASELMRITGEGNVAIGQGSASASLLVQGADQVDGTMRLQAHSNKGARASHIHHGTNGDWYIRSADTDGKVIINDGGGNLGIGDTTATTTVDLTGALLMRSNINNIGLSTYTVGNGMTTATGGELEFIHQWTGTMHTNDTIAFTYNALNWKSWWFEILISSTGANGEIFRAGGYNNNSSGHSVTQGSGASLAVSRSGQANTFTLTLSNTHIHPLIKIRYGCGGGEGPPQISRASLVITS